MARQGSAGGAPAAPAPSSFLFLLACPALRERTTLYWPQNANTRRSAWYPEKIEPACVRA